MAAEKDLSARGFAIVIVGVGALLCCGTPTAGFYHYRKDARDEPGIRAAGDAYLSAVARRDFAAAYDLLCAADRRRQSRDDWLAWAPSDPAPTGYRITDVRIERPGGTTPTLRSVTAEVTFAQWGSRTVHLNIERQDGHWKVCSPDVF
ncbi:hypothetical protein AB0M91_25615 [Micromonospora rifamycinica]|uniref:Rv0361 family membrane protein n=1 Tax=Micromonospora rifamycinica TaxID=291594 RepID=UPI0033FBFDF6